MTAACSRWSRRGQTRLAEFVLGARNGPGFDVFGEFGADFGLMKEAQNCYTRCAGFEVEAD
jgi:hypothetical protein